MIRSRLLSAACAFTLLAAGASGCASHGRGERAGRAVDRGVDKVDEKTDEVGDEIEHGVERGKDKTERAVEELKK
jgi:hypothetical protein